MFTAQSIELWFSISKKIITFICSLYLLSTNFNESDVWRKGHLLKSNLNYMVSFNKW